MKKILLYTAVILSMAACSQKEKIDLLIYNATVYTVDSSFSMAEAIAVKDGKIVTTGKTVELQEKYDVLSMRMLILSDTEIACKE